jgi:MYXO-CTERM domain-containing protein
MRFSAAALTLAAVLAAPLPARANGAFPFVSQLVSNAAHPEQLVLRGNFGLVVSRDAGKNWDWLCEAGMGYQNVEPPIALLDSGVIVLATPTGIVRGDSSWCRFETLTNQGNFVDVSAEHAKPQAAVALSVDLNGLSSQVWESLDDGKTFQPLGPALSDFIATTIDVAASDAQVIYVSGTSSDGKGLLLRSQDHGASYQPHELPSSLLISTAPYISALDPHSPDTVYLRSDSAPGTLMITRDGGQKLEEMLRLSAPIKAFALSPDGSAVLAATVGSGIYRIDTQTLQQDKLACTGVWCFTWTKDGVFACGDIIANGYLVAASSDEGRTFESLVTPTCLRGPFACDAATSIGKACPDAWPSQRSLLGPNACITDVPEPDQGCLANAGSGMGGGAAQAGAPSQAGAAGDVPAEGGRDDGSFPEGGAPASPTSGAGGKVTAKPPLSASDASGGCDCAAAGRGGNDWAALVLLALLAAVRRRK